MVGGAAVRGPGPIMECAAGERCKNVDQTHFERYAHPPHSLPAVALAHWTAVRMAPCKYGLRCHDASAAHHEAFAHFCRYGGECRRRNPAHKRQYMHPTTVATTAALSDAADLPSDFRGPDDPPDTDMVTAPSTTDLIVEPMTPPSPRRSREDTSVTDSRDDAGSAPLRLAAGPAALMALHAGAPRLAARASAAGLLPVTIDPDTKCAFFLLGLSERGPDRTLCHFHGFVDAGESRAQAAAREGWEESRGVLGSQLDLWRAVAASRAHPHERPTFAIPFAHHNCNLVRLRDMSQRMRDDLAADFHRAPRFYPCMDETASVVWVPAAALSAAAVERRSCQGLACYPPGTRLRHFLNDVFCSPEARERSWGAPGIVALLKHGNAEPLGLLPLTQLPPLEPMEPLRRDAIAMLPASPVATREMLLQALNIPLCGRCHREGHIAAVCPAPASEGREDPHATRLDGTLLVRNLATPKVGGGHEHRQADRAVIDLVWRLTCERGWKRQNAAAVSDDVAVTVPLSQLRHWAAAAGVDLLALRPGEDPIRFPVTVSVEMMDATRVAATCVRPA